MNWHIWCDVQMGSIRSFCCRPWGETPNQTKQTQAKAGVVAGTQAPLCVRETLHQSSDRAPRRTAGEISHAVVSLAVRKLAL